MEAVPRLSMICCDLKVSPSNTEFGPELKKYIRHHYHEDPESYSKEIKELEALRQNAIKAPMDFTGCSILKKYYSQLQKLQSRFPMTDDGASCVPFMWTDIYSGVAYNITDIEYEEACILYNIGALHSKLGTMDSRVNAEGIKIACTHFQCAAWAFQHLRDTYPQPKGSDMSHDLLIYFINVMLAQAQECILEKSMLDNRKSSITAKIATQVVDYYKCALGIMVAGSPSTDTGSILDIVGSKVYKGWKKFIDFKMSYYTSISHLYMGNQAEENEKWGERVAWFQSAYDHLTEAFKFAKKLDRDDINDALTFTNDVIGGKHSSSKKENDFVYHDKVPAISSLPEPKGASLVKGIPFSASDLEVSGPDIFARLVPIEAHETSSLYSEEKAKILRSVVSRIEGKNEELMAYLSSLQLESAMSFDDEDKVPQELIEKCAALSVRPTAIADLTNLMNELFDVSKDVEASLKASIALLAEEDQKELKHQETFGKRGPSMITVDLKKECSKYEEAHKKAIASNNTLQAAVSIHIGNLTKLSAPLDQIIESLPSACSLKTPESVKATDNFNHLVNKVEEMRKQRHFLENQLRDALQKDDITKRLVTLDKKDHLQNTFVEELKKHTEILTYLDQNLTAQDNILCALTESNARYADTRKALREIRLKREEMIKTLVSSFDAYEDLMEKAKKGLDFYKKLQSNAIKLLTRIKSVTNVQDEERDQRAEAELRKGGRVPGFPAVAPEQHVPKLKDYLPFLNKRGGPGVAPAASFNMYPSLQPNAPTPHSSYVPEPMRQATLGGPATAEFDRSLKPSATNNLRPEDSFDVSSMGIRPTPVGSEQTSVPAMCTTALSNAGAGNATPYTTSQLPWNSTTTAVNGTPNNSHFPYQYPTQNMYQQPPSIHSSCATQLPYVSNSTSTLAKDQTPYFPQGYNPAVSAPSSYGGQSYSFSSQQPSSHYASSVRNAPYSPYSNTPQTNYQVSSNVSVNQQPYPPSSFTTPNAVASSTMQNSTVSQDSVYPPGHPAISALPAGNPQSVTHTVQTTIPSSGVPVSSPVPPGSISPAVETAYSLSYPSAAVHGSIGASLNNAGAPSNTFTRNAYSTPYSNQTAVPSMPSSANTGLQNQTYSTWQPNQLYSNPSSYDMPTSSYNPGSSVTYSSTINSMQPGATVQAKQACVTASMDTKTSTFNSLNPYAVANSNVNPYSTQNMYNYMANATLNAPGASNLPPGSMQSQTSFTSTQSQPGISYAVQGVTGGITSPVQSQISSPQNAIQGLVNIPPGAFRDQSSIPATSIQAQVGYAASGIIQPQSCIDIPAAVHPQSNIASPGTMQPQSGTAVPGTVQAQSSITTNTVQNHAGSNYPPQNTYNGYSASSANVSMYSTVPSSYSYTGSSPLYAYSNYNSYTPSSQVLSNTTYTGNVPAAGTPQNYPAVQNNASVPSNMNIQYNSYAFPQQQNDQPAASITDSINVAYGSNSCIPNQQLHTPIEPKPLVPTQSDHVRANQVNSDSAIHSDPIPRPSSTDIQVNAKGDFVTPPPDPVHETFKEDASQVLEVLQPKAVDLKTISGLKEKESSYLAKDPLDDLSVQTKFVSEVEKYEKFVEGLVRKSLNGTTPLDQKWKEFTDVQDKESRKRSISVARCCPLKNRFPDVMPYDCNRVKLTSAKDDYINASYLKDFCPNSLLFVITQAPLPATFNDFWLMVWEQQVETLICLLSDSELKSHVYFPKDRGQVLTYGAYEISLHSHKEKNGFVERMINLTHVKNRTSRVVVHLQFTEWPTSGVPCSPATILQFITDTLSYYKQQRNLVRPIVVHCSAGIGRSGCFCLITAMVWEMNQGHGPRDVTQVAASVSHQRKFLIQDKDQLKFCYDTVLYYAQDLLMRRGILTTRASFDDKLPGSTTTSSHVRHPSEDFILGGGLAKLQSGIAKLGLSSDSSETKAVDSEMKTETTASEISLPVGNGDVNQDVTTCDSKSDAYPQTTQASEAADVSQNRNGSSDKPVSSITSLLDPSNFTLDAVNSPVKRKITKENFANSKGTLSTSNSDCADPLSLLDPLWSLKK